MEYLKWAIDVIRHLDKHLDQLAAWGGPWTYAILIAIIFAETGLVVMPFLPGDSLLFGVGALAAGENAVINVWLIGIGMTIAAILGDAVNYSIGRKLGPAIFRSDKSVLLNRGHLEKAQKFYDKYGGKTIILARFIPLIRTFAPFVAGIGKMSYPKFAAYNIIGAIAWIWSLLLAGYFFGRMPIVQKNFGLVVIAIIVISLLPAVYEFWKARKESKAPGFDVVEATTVGESPNEPKA